VNSKKRSLADEDGISISDILIIIAKQVKIILFVPVVFCFFAILKVQFFSEPIYTSVSKIKASGGSGGATQALGLAAQFGLSLGSSQSNQKWAYPEVIKSRTIAKTLLKKHFNTKRYSGPKTLFEILSDGAVTSKKSNHIREENALAFVIKNMIKVSENLKSGILTLKINSFEPNLSKEINNALIQELDLYQKKYNQSKKSDARIFIEERISDIEQQLQSAENDLKDFMIRNRRIENSPNLLLEQQRLGREVAVLTGVFTTLKQQLETTKIDEVKESDYIIIIDPPDSPISYSSPKKRKFVTFFGFLGISLGFLLAFLTEYFKFEEREKIRTAKDLLIKNFFQLIPWKNN
jgi:tyrosine-protein kinase Etk/Wzc